MEEAEDSGAQEAAEERANEERESEPQDTHDERTISGILGHQAAAKEKKGADKYYSKSRAIKAGSNRREYQSAKLCCSLAAAETGHSAYYDEDDTRDGAVGIIYHKDKETGNLEFLFEEKPFDYPVPEARGRLSFVGGAIKRGETSLEALVRELKEEIEEPFASIVLESLRTDGNFYQRLPYEYKGTRGYTDIYTMEIKQEDNWNVVRWAAFQHDAGSPKILTHRNMRADDFAFGYGEIAQRFASDAFNSGSRVFAPFMYADSIHPASNALSSFDLAKYAVSKF
jgi:8-oxo-dGTP pyrophosphatase MutT (NUDIX family)